MLKTTEPVIIMTKAELESVIYSAVKKAVSEVFDRLEANGEISVAPKMRQRNRTRPDREQLAATAVAAPMWPPGDARVAVSDTRLLRMPQVLERVGLKKTVVYERIKDGTFPKPIKLGSASAWNAHEIEAWIAGQASGS